VSKCHGFYDIAINPAVSHSIFVVLNKYDRSSLSTMTRRLIGVQPHCHQDKKSKYPQDEKLVVFCKKYTKFSS